MEYILKILIYLILFLLVFLTIAFFTLLEEKVLCSIHACKGPIYVGYIGIFQSFAYALKLSSYIFTNRKYKNLVLYIIRPFFSLILSVFMWVFCPFTRLIFNIDKRILYLIIIIGIRVFPILIRGWGSNNKYTIIGSLRRVSQIISYEVSLGFILLYFIFLLKGLSLLNIYSNLGFLGVFINMPLFYITYASLLAETSRRPFDFTERASELVCGFHTEYGGLNFTVLFISEYISIIFIRTLIVLIFMNIRFFLFGTLISFFCFLFIWARGTIIRFRYDLMIILNWKVFLPQIIYLYSYVVCSRFLIFF